MARRHRTPASEPPAEPALARLLALLRRPAGRALVKAAAASLAVLLVALVMRQARAHAYRLPEYRLGTAGLELADLPPWVDGRARAMLLDPRRLAFEVSIFDPGAEEVVSGALTRHPMVREVQEVRLLYPNRARVRLWLRVPVARVLVPVRDARGAPATQTLFLSADARRLDPWPYLTWLEARPRPLPILTGIRGAWPRAAGQAWETVDEQVAEALAAVRVAERLHEDLDRRHWVAEVDVARFPARERRVEGEVLLVLQDGRRVEWGRTERDLRGVVEEDDYATKLRRLKVALARGVRDRVDVRWPEERGAWD